MTQGIQYWIQRKGFSQSLGTGSENVKRLQEEHFLFPLPLLCPYLFITFFSLSNISLPLPSLPLTHTALFPVSSLASIILVAYSDPGFPWLHMLKTHLHKWGFSSTINLQENLIVVLIQVDTLDPISFWSRSSIICVIYQRPCWGRHVTPGKEDEFPKRAVLLWITQGTQLLSHSMVSLSKTFAF